MSRYQQPAFLYGSLHVRSFRRLGLTRILIKHYTRTISRCICRQAARFNRYLCRENGALLAYSAVGPSGSERREELRRQGKMKNLAMRKSPPFKRKKIGGYKQGWWWAVADGSLWGNEMIIRVLTGKWTAIVALMLGVIIDFLLC